MVIKQNQTLQKLFVVLLMLGGTYLFSSCLDEDAEKAMEQTRSYEPYKVTNAFADEVEHKLEGGITASKWMSGLDDNTRICKLSIPGTHDSATGMGFYNDMLEYVFNMTAISQVSTLSDQLNSGIRFFDIRPVVSNDTLTHEDILRCCHGISVINHTFEDALNDFAGFLQENPKEFLIIKLQGDNGVDNQQYWMPLMNYMISNYTYKGKGDFFTEWKPDMTVGEARGKIILINRTLYTEMKGAYCNWMDENADKDKTDTIRIEDERNQIIYNVTATDSTRLAAQDYYKTDTEGRMELKKKAVRSMLEFAADSCTSKSDNNTWVINHTSAYTSVSPRGYMENAGKVNPVAIDYLLGHKGKTVGIVVMDFACFDKVSCIINGGTPYTSDFMDEMTPMSASLTNLLIMSNFKKQ